MIKLAERGVCVDGDGGKVQIPGMCLAEYRGGTANGATLGLVWRAR